MKEVVRAEDFSQGPAIIFIFIITCLVLWVSLVTGGGYGFNFKLVQRFFSSDEGFLGHDVHLGDDGNWGRHGVFFQRN